MSFVDNDDVYQERQALLQDQQLSLLHSGWSAENRFDDKDDDNINHLWMSGNELGKVLGSL